jgi:hypothetical protein
VQALEGASWKDLGFGGGGTLGSLSRARSGDSGCAVLAPGPAGISRLVAHAKQKQATHLFL